MNLASGLYDDSAIPFPYGDGVANSETTDFFLNLMKTSALPFMPTASFVNYYVSKVDLISICTVFLAYVGIGIGRDWDDFKKIGWRGIIVAIFVITGTYICSATVADIVLILTGSI